MHSRHQKSRNSVRFWPLAFYSLLALAIMGPMLKAGYILTLDMVFVPKIAAPTVMSNNYIWLWLLHLANLVIPSQIIEKIIIFVILLSTGIGIHRLIRTRSPIARYFGGIFYIVNPWTYERWMAGHYLLVAGYAVVPFFYYYLLRVLERPQRKDTIICVLFLVIISIVSLHMAVLASILTVVTMLVHLFKRSRQSQLEILKYVFVMMAGIFVASSYWLRGFLTGQSQAAQEIAHFDIRHLEAFTTQAQSKFGLLVNVLGGYGFWLEKYHRYIRPNEVTVIFVIGFVALGTLIALGIRQLWREQRRLVVSLLFTAVVAFVFAAGIHAPILGPIVKLILLHVPIIRGFREPEKFSALLVFAYAIFASYGVDAISHGARDKLGLKFAPFLLLLIPIVYVPTMLWGCSAQLTPVQYPASWYGFNDYLRENPGKYKVLFLPWHQYMSYDFSPRIIASPAPRFFTGNIIAGDNAEFGDVVRDTNNPTSDVVEAALRENGTNQFAMRLAGINVKYIVLSAGYDYPRYSFLLHDPNLKLVSAKPSLFVWQNMLYKEQKP